MNISKHLLFRRISSPAMNGSHLLCKVKTSVKDVFTSAFQKVESEQKETRAFSIMEESFFCSS